MLVDYLQTIRTISTDSKLLDQKEEKIAKKDLVSIFHEDNAPVHKWPSPSYSTDLATSDF